MEHWNWTFSFRGSHAQEISRPTNQSTCCHHRLQDENKRVHQHLVLFFFANIARAIGDCATIEQPRLLSKFEELFKEVDTENIGYLRRFEFTKLVELYRHKYPQLELYGKKIQELFDEAGIRVVRSCLFIVWISTTIIYCPWMSSKTSSLV